MISILHGKVISQETDGIIVDVNGVGFHVMVPTPLRDRLQSGETIYLYTRMIVREDAWILCGFETKEGREVFDLLLSVNGIGPRLALSILSTLSPDTIRRAVFNDQAEIFSRVPGIGNKTAQKIVLHLQDRLPSNEGLAPLARISEVDTEVLAALTTLGYSLVEAQAALQYIPRDTPQEVETRLRIALQYFSTP
ncbi:MAG: Holliday junction DNA helicase RuvA [Chloroflexi bacterium RBG_19FT_COMBO_47_9]|nr:MAG: Holliday junction DNA helicase RuvA [Chloroflexi bacterium RBG_19FT_COMBO_47_9]